MPSLLPIVRCNKRKRMPGPYDFETFGKAGCPIDPIGAFRDNVREFVRECATAHEDNNVLGMRAWCTHLTYRSSIDIVVPLYTIVEDVTQSPRPFCDHCRCTGWGNHFVSKRNYYFIIPAAEEWDKPLVHGFMDLQTHLLQGLIHCNGFGHLLCINGIAGGSKYLHGREIMDLWDRLCGTLRTRKITIQDLSRKGSMALRLLYGVGYEHSWYGRWGYKFHRGSFGVRNHEYYEAIEVLRSLDLDEIVQEFSDTDKCREIKQIISHYRNKSETQLTTLGDLLRFMLTTRSHASVHINKKVMAGPSFSTSKPSNRIMPPSKSFVKEKSLEARSLTSVIAHLDCQWPAEKIEYVAKVMVNALKENNSGEFCRGWMTRQDLRDAAQIHIRDTGLLDRVLKLLNNVVVGRHVVCRTMNPTTRTLKYSIHELGKKKASEQETEVIPEPFIAPAWRPGDDVYSDLVYLYRNILLDSKSSDRVQRATQAVLNSKYFVKEWSVINENEHLLTFTCKLIPSLGEIETELKMELPPGEVVVIPLHATVGELKRAVEKAVRDTYCITENFSVTEIEELEELEDKASVFGAVTRGTELCVRGSKLAFKSTLSSQAGAESWKIRCKCGTQDDDGERMVACDICDVWQHTYCRGIQDSDAVPLHFLCERCDFSNLLALL